MLFFAACGGNKANPSAPNSHNHTMPILGDGLIAVKMRPAQVVEAPFAPGEISNRFRSPSALGRNLTAARQASFEESDLLRDGADYEAELPMNRVAADGGNPLAVEFSPDWNPSSGLSSAAYCAYRWPLEDYGTSMREQTLGLSWEGGAPPAGEFFIGLGNVLNDSWDWYAGEPDNVVTFPSFTTYEEADGSVLVILIVLGQTPTSLAELQIGAFETRGTGGNPEPFTSPAPLWPDFPLQADLTVDLSPLTGPVGDQLNVASCTAWAATGAYNYELAQIYADCDWDLELPAFRMSPRYLYISTGSGDDSCPGGGRPIWGSADWMRENGVVREVTAPYQTTEAEPPANGGNPYFGFHCNESWDSGDEATETALFQPDVVPLLSTEDEDTGRQYLNDAQINACKAILRILRHPLGMNTNLDSSFSSTDYAGGESWTFSGVQSGSLSHAMLIVGYDDNRNGGSFKVKNQYGADWGDEGYCWITYASMQDERANAYAYFIVDSYDPDIADEYCPEPPVFLPPFGLASPTRHDDRIELAWDMVEGASSYLVYRDSKETELIVVGGAETGYTDRSVDDYLTHVYWVRAESSVHGVSGFSSPLLAWRQQP
jgi:hypothetical protein